LIITTLTVDNTKKDVKFEAKKRMHK